MWGFPPKSADVVWDDTRTPVNLLDLLLIGLVALAGLSGFRRGALLQLLTYGGLLLGLIAGAVAAPMLASLSHDPSTQAAIAAGTLLVFAGLGDVAGWVVGARVRAAARSSRFSPADSAGGSLVAILAVLLSVWFVTLNLVNGPIPELSSEIRNSTIVRTLGQVLPQPPSVLAEVRQFLNRFDFPEVFTGFPPAPAGPVKPPTAGQAGRAFRAASASTVRVVGRACGRLQEGSGFVVAPDYVLTNAHVVAGVRTPQVQEQNGGDQPGTVVLYDPELDVALVRVARSPGPVLHLLGTDAQRSARGAVVGYPGGGDLAGKAAAVRGTIEAVGRDIYGNGTVTREVYELQSVIRPGNSGGPFVLVDGEVAGLVFAASTTDPEIGYALTSTEVLPSVRSGVGRTTPTPTGACVR
jgi:S1-C subfamily serine protease